MMKKIIKLISVSLVVLLSVLGNLASAWDATTNNQKASELFGNQVVTNDFKDFSIKLTKTDGMAEEGKTTYLPGAYFEVYLADSNGDIVTTGNKTYRSVAVSDNSGVVSFDKLYAIDAGDFTNYANWGLYRQEIPDPTVVIAGSSDVANLAKMDADDAKAAAYMNKITDPSNETRAINLSLASEAYYVVREISAPKAVDTDNNMRRYDRGMREILLQITMNDESASADYMKPVIARSIRQSHASPWEAWTTPPTLSADNVIDLGERENEYTTFNFKLQKKDVSSQDILDNTVAKTKALFRSVKVTYTGGAWTPTGVSPVDLTVDSNNFYVTGNLEKGSYYVVYEETAPHGYALTDVAYLVSHSGELNSQTMAAKGVITRGAQGVGVVSFKQTEAEAPVEDDYPLALENFYNDYLIRLTKKDEITKKSVTLRSQIIWGFKAIEETSLVSGGDPINIKDLTTESLGTLTLNYVEKTLHKKNAAGGKLAYIVYEQLAPNNYELSDKAYIITFDESKTSAIYPDGEIVIYTGTITRDGGIGAASNAITLTDYDSASPVELDKADYTLTNQGEYHVQASANFYDSPKPDGFLPSTGTNVPIEIIIAILSITGFIGAFVVYKKSLSNTGTNVGKHKKVRSEGK
ncbi:MAG: hypothetical protein LBS33_04135 [Streptococcaceae bacterium]|jgi:hypothetical protein|nr:hypothetical protein [Streptococcaceae bacterium]